MTVRDPFCTCLLAHNRCFYILVALIFTLIQLIFTPIQQAQLSRLVRNCDLIRSLFLIQEQHLCNSYNLADKLFLKWMICARYSDVTWASWRLKSPTTVCTMCSANFNEHIKAAYNWSFVRSPMDCPRKKPVMRIAFLCHDVIIHWALRWRCLGRQRRKVVVEKWTSSTLVLLPTFICRWWLIRPQTLCHRHRKMPCLSELTQLPTIETL